MNVAEKRKTRVNKGIHYVTIAGIFLLIIPAAINEFYINIVFLLVGINLFNGFYLRIGMNNQRLFLLGLISLLPLIVYRAIKYFL